MTFRQAWDLVGVAGRELGGGPAEAVKRLLPNHGLIIDQCDVWGMSAERSGSMLLGLAVGLVMAEDETALQTLRDIEQEWREHHHD
jgi:hypothetical protein